MGIISAITKEVNRKPSVIDGKKALLIPENGQPIPVQFNPSQYTITDSAAYSQRERRKEDEPSVNYNGAVLSTLNVQLIFNSAVFPSIDSAVHAVGNFLRGEQDADITETIDKISELTRIDGEEHKPPFCVFVWGSLQFAGYVETVGVTYNMFDSSGKPLSAVVNLTMRGTNAAVGGERKSPFQSPDRTKARVMTEDANIWGIAEKEYGDAREWRRIAEANDVMNPLDIPIGKVLRVPSIDD